LAGANTKWAQIFVRQCGAYLALAALALQLALSFAHIHRHDLGISKLGRADVVSVGHGRFTQRAAAQHPSRLGDGDNCPICFSGFLLSNAALPGAPANPHLLRYAALDQPFNPISDRVLPPPCAAFSSRAPPTA
jgi:hypothetical protein